MKKYLFKILLVCTLVFSFSISNVIAEPFTIMTEDYAPFNYKDKGKLTGLSSEVMFEISKRVGHPSKIKILPWSEAYQTIQKKDGHILFSMTRTEQREDLFKWVGPIAPNKWVFYAKKGSGLNIKNLDDARKVAKIGTYKDDAAEIFLKKEGFKNLNSVVNDDENAAKLIAGEIDLWIVSELQGVYKTKKSGMDSASLEKVLDVKDTQLYIAFSKNTSESEIAKWQKALEDMKADGTYQKIMSKYL